MPVTIEGVIYYQFPAAVVEDADGKRVPNATAAVLASPTGAPLTVRNLAGAVVGLMTNVEGTLPGFLAPQLAPVTIDMGAARLPLASLEVGTLVLDVGASKTAAESSKTAAESAASSAASSAAAAQTAVAPTNTAIDNRIAVQKGAANGLATLGPDSKVPAAQLPPLTQSTRTAAYTATLADAGTLVEFNSASALTFTIPTDASVVFPIGTVMGVRQYGAGQVTVAPATGVTIRSRGAAFKTAGQYAEATLTKRGADEWVLVGDVAV